MELVLVLYRVVVSRSLSHPKGDEQKKRIWEPELFECKIISITCLHFEFCFNSGVKLFPGSRLDLVSFWSLCCDKVRIMENVFILCN